MAKKKKGIAAPEKDKTGTKPARKKSLLNVAASQNRIDQMNHGMSAIGKVTTAQNWHAVR